MVERSSFQSECQATYSMIGREIFKLLRLFTVFKVLRDLMSHDRKARALSGTSQSQMQSFHLRFRTSLILTCRSRTNAMRINLDTKTAESYRPPNPSTIYQLKKK